MCGKSPRMECSLQSNSNKQLYGRNVFIFSNVHRDLRKSYTRSGEWTRFTNLLCCEPLKGSGFLLTWEEPPADTPSWFVSFILTIQLPVLQTDTKNNQVLLTLQHDMENQEGLLLEDKEPHNTLCSSEWHSVMNFSMCDTGSVFIPYISGSIIRPKYMYIQTVMDIFPLVLTHQHRFPLRTDPVWSFHIATPHNSHIFQHTPSLFEYLILDNEHYHSSVLLYTSKTCRMTCTRSQECFQLTSCSKHWWSSSDTLNDPLSHVGDQEEKTKTVLAEEAKETNTYSMHQYGTL